MALLPSSAAMSDVVASHGRVEGLVESFDLANGIEGWAIDLEQPEARLTVELVIGDMIVARTVVDRPRNDLAIAPGREMMAGFAFQDILRDGVREAVAAGAQGLLGVRVVGSSTMLRSLAPPPDASDAVAMTNMAVSEDSGFDILARLSQLRGKAAALSRISLRADPANLAGYIEQIAIDEGGLVWFSGWMKNRTAADMPVLIFDGQRVPGAIATTMFTREDLGSEACGMIGVIQSDWRPNPGADLYIFFEDGKSYLQAVKAYTLSSKRDFAEYFSFRWPISYGGHRLTLRHLLDHPDSWQPTDGLSGARVRAMLEEVYVLPNFGALVTGWVLSPLKTVEGFAMRFGSTVLECDRDSIGFRARHDLWESASGCDLLPGRAGFVAVFRGPIGPRDIDSPTLKVFLGDGTASIHAIDAGAVRRLGLAASIDQVRHLYPALTSEGFFPDLALALREEARSQASKVTPLQIERCETALIFAVPDERSDAFLLFDEVGRRARGQALAAGLIFVAGRNAIRPTAIALFRQLAAATDTPCSLFLSDDPAGALYAVPQLLVATGADRFAFFGPAAIPTEAGWEALDHDGDLLLFALQDPARIAGEGSLSLEAFAWRRGAFVAWIDSVPAFVGGPRSDAVRLLPDIEPRAVPQGALLLRPEAPAPVIRAINDVAANAA
jgi:hypothetical protein